MYALTALALTFFGLSLVTSPVPEQPGFGAITLAAAAVAAAPAVVVWRRLRPKS